MDSYPIGGRFSRRSDGSRLGDPTCYHQRSRLEVHARVLDRALQQVEHQDVDLHSLAPPDRRPVRENQSEQNLRRHANDKVEEYETAHNNAALLAYLTGLPSC